MFIVGELINASRKAVAAAIEAKDRAAIAKLAADQLAAGANYVDVNAGIFVDREPELLTWLVRTVQEATGAPCCLDSPDPKAIEAALAVHQGPAMINSISLEKNRLDSLLSLLAGTDLKVVALCMSDAGMPETAQDRLKIAGALIDVLVRHKVKPENIHVDPLVQPVSTNPAYGREFLAAVEGIRTGHPGVNTICGLSNVSYGLPERKLLNQTFLLLALARGLNGAIINPLDRRIMAGILATEALLGRDEYCLNFIQAFRAGKLAL